MSQELSFEQGPIRPPSEAKSLLLRVTRNCSWNKCLFCSTYQGRTFSRRSVAEVKGDIDTVVRMMERITEASFRRGLAGAVDEAVANYFLGRAELDHSFHNVAAWMYWGTRAVFLQDANNLILPAGELVEMLEYLNKKIPDISRVTTYSRTATVARKSLEELTRIRQAGLGRVHLGLESGCAEVLDYVHKGVSPEKHVAGGVKARQAGMEVSLYYMPGLGGRRWRQAHALESASIINQINPHFIRLRTTHIGQPHPLYASVESGEFELLSDDETVEEIRLFIEHLTGIDSYLASDHMGNLLQDVEGRLPGDKPRMLSAIDSYLELDEEERLHYRVGRVMGLYAGVGDMLLPARHAQVEQALASLEARFPGRVEEALTQIVNQMI